MATLIEDGLVQYAPATNLYQLPDGRYVLVTVPDNNPPLPPALAVALAGVKVDRVIEGPTEIFLSDESGVVLDGDGDPANGMTPIARYPAGTTHEEALRLLAGDLQE